MRIIKILFSLVAINILVGFSCTPSVKEFGTGYGRTYDQNHYVVKGQGNSEGYFQGIECEEYCFLIINDDEAKENRFLFFKTYDNNLDIEKLFDDENLIGQRVIVEWQKIEIYFPPCICIEQFEELLNIEFLE